MADPIDSSPALSRRALLRSLAVAGGVALAGPTLTGIEPARAALAGADDFARLRQRWFDALTGGTDFDPNDPDVARQIAAIDRDAGQWWTTLNTSPGRAYLWEDQIPTGNDPKRQINQNLLRLRDMALAYRTKGSELAERPELRDEIISALDWIYANHYNENSERIGNSFYLTLGIPLVLSDVIVLMRSDLSEAQLGNHMLASAAFADLDSVVPGTRPSAVIKLVKITALRGALLQDAGQLMTARDRLSEVFAYVTEGDGFYRDGSFVYHGRLAENGGYGASSLLNITDAMSVLAESPWDVVDPRRAVVNQWVYDSFEHWVYRGAMMDSVRGRTMSRPHQDEHVIAHSTVIPSVLLLARAGGPDATAFAGMVKHWITTDTYFDTFEPPTIPPGLDSTRRVEWVLSIKQLLASGTPAREPIGHWTYGSMDRVLHRRPGWALALSMHSSRIYNYESINRENLRGWYTGSGATYLYTDDLAQLADDFWATVDPYGLPGTTVQAEELPDSFRQKRTSTSPWAGGAQLGEVGTAGMEVASVYGSLTARKSWFFFDDAVIALGSSISAQGQAAVATHVENRKVPRGGSLPLQLDGQTAPGEPGWSTTRGGLRWAHIGGVAGYVFPGGARVHASREQRTGRWADVNAEFGREPYGPEGPVTNDFVRLSIPHGSAPRDAGYVYAVLPLASASDTAAWARLRPVEVLADHSGVHAIEHGPSRVLAANVWDDLPHQIGPLSCTGRASVLMRRGREIEIAVSDPTQSANEPVRLELRGRLGEVVSADPRITVESLGPPVRITVDLSGLAGETVGVTLRPGRRPD